MNPSATILVVDDEPKAQVLLRNLLEIEGYRVLFASNGPEAIRAAAMRPDVILLDLMMPGMDGYTVCQRLRATPSVATVPIIMLTALDDRASKLKGLQAGADDFLTKPFDSAELRARLRTITRLNRYRSLAEERARFEAAIEHSSEGIVLTERDGTILHRNAAFAALLDGVRLAPSNFFLCLPEPIRAALLQELQGQATPAPARRETELLAPCRPGTYVELTLSLVPWEARTIVQFHVRDLTERKALEAQLLRSQRIELLGQLAGSVVHDMNNVLSAIGGSATLLTMDPEKPEAYLRNIQLSVQRGAGMMRQLLLFARGSDGEFKPVNLAETVAEVGELVRTTFPRYCEVSYAVPAEVPLVTADSTQIHQVLMNLCVNARDAMPDGGKLHIELSSRTLAPAEAQTHAADGARAGDFVTISVRDSGTGIPPDVRPRLFDPFFTTKALGKGTGLGLATVMRVVRRHGGFITVDTQVGEGTCFTCYFPIVPSPVAVPAALQPA